MASTTPRSRTNAEPPADAVARDPHWSATREKLRSRLRPTAKLTICDDHEVKQQLSEAEFKLKHAKARLEQEPDAVGGQAAITAAEQALATAQAAFDEVAIVLRFQALERPLFEALKDKHPATEEQARDGDRFNVEALGPELIAASSLDGITEEDARYYLNTWAEGEAANLFNTAWNVQNESRMDVGKG